MDRLRSIVLAGFGLGMMAVIPLNASDDQQQPPGGGSISFRDIAVNGGGGIDFRRAPSTTNIAYEALKHQATYTFTDLLATPDKARGSPGVALLDYDDDGALDIFVTNGPGAGNKLYRNLLLETGQPRFVDVAGLVGVAAPEMDATGVCYGDVDNDGHEDLYVLGRNEPNRLWMHQDDGTFMEAGSEAGVGGGTFNHTSCSIGDINGDGWLDIVVANTEDWSNQLAIIAVPFDLNQPNQLFLNLGDGRFIDVSLSSGFRDLAGLPPGVATISWAVAMVDYDLDGDIDIIHADDQGAFPRASYGGIDRGLIHLLRNDGTGHFTDRAVAAGTNKAGAWMGLAFGDFNSDGSLDFFATNFGDYGLTALPFPYTLGDFTSRWFLGRPDGTFADPGVGDLVVTPFGWGTSPLDYDNDGSTDVAFFGHIDVGLIVITDNPGVLLRNDGTAHFAFNSSAFASTDYSRLAIFGSAAGDLNNDGFDDIVTVSAMDIPGSVPLTRFPVSLPPQDYGSPFDSTAYFVEQFSPIGPESFAWRGYEFPDGTLQVQINSADNGNGWVQIRTRGSVGLLPDGRVNRDGIGATVTFTPKGGRPVMKPIVAGSGFASADSLLAGFGLADAQKGTVEVLWPGGVRNRLYDVRRGERIVFPEIPCSFDAGDELEPYVACVRGALDRLVLAGSVKQADRTRFLTSAIRAFESLRPDDFSYFPIRAARSQSLPPALLSTPHATIPAPVIDADLGIASRVAARALAAASLHAGRGELASTPAERRAAVDTVWGPGLPTEVKLQIFDTFWTHVDDRFAAFQGIDVDWAALRDRYRSEVAAGVSRGRFAAIINRMSLALRDGHTLPVDLLVNVFTLPEPGVPLLGIGSWVFDTSGACLTAQDDGSALVYDAVSPHPLGLTRGDRILGYDGRPWRELIDQLIEEELPIWPLWWGSGPEGYEHSLVMSAGLNWHLFDTMDVMKQATGAVVHLPTSLMPGVIFSNFCSEQMAVAGVDKPGFYGSDLVRWGIVEGTNIGYIYVWGWLDPAAADFAAAVDELTGRQQVDGLIIDFRFNAGGFLRAPFTGLAALFEHPSATIGMDQRMLSSDHLKMQSLYPPSRFKVDFDRAWQRDQASYAGPIALLVGPGAISAGDFGSIWAGYHPNVRTFGKTTAMAAGLPTQPILGTSLDLHPTWFGTIAETNTYRVGRPKDYLIHTDLPVDERVWLQPEDVAAGRDTVVEAALRWLRLQAAITEPILQAGEVK